jgi:thiosulfate reductase cytochrome b subunit
VKKEILAFAVVSLMLAVTASAEEANPMHPAFVPLDDSGKPLAETGKSLSPEKTCGRCHDVGYISAHNSHSEAGASCIDCHAEGGKLEPTPSMMDREGALFREFVRIRSPRNSNCASCHGIIHEGTVPLSLPGDIESSASSYGITLKTGAILSPERLSDSFMNLAGKQMLSYPWDLHLARGLNCIDCHFSRNNPARAGHKSAGLEHLTFDPRKPGISDFISRPDHTLATANCLNCHDPMAAHASMQFMERHIRVLECQACHSDRLFGPARETVDQTVVAADGSPISYYRGFEDPGPPSGGSHTKGFSPYLLPVQPARGKSSKLVPFNLTTRFFWAAGKTGTPVPSETVRSAYFENGAYRQSIVRIFDRDGDGRLSYAELRIDTPVKLSTVKGRLESLGVDDPQIRGEVVAHKVSHGVISGSRIASDCGLCHKRDSRISANPELSPYTPVGAVVTFTKSDGGPGTGLTYESGGKLLMRRPTAEGVYILGHSRDNLTDKAGFLMFLAVLAGVTVHAGLRWHFRKKRCGEPAQLVRRYTFSLYERLWHWLMALSVMALVVTGLDIHWASTVFLIPLPQAVHVHNIAAVIMVVNAGLALFYNIASAAIRRFIPNRDSLLRRITDQVQYYSRGIFMGARHPLPDSVEQHLNPLQQITYLALLNVLFPLQIVTGILMFGISKWPDFSAAIGGMTVIAPLHNIGSWLFISFFVMHIYLTTTGHTLTSNIRAMITGYQEFETACTETEEEKK